MLTWIDPSGFKSFASKTDALTLSPLTLLVGGNAAGKSNLLELIRFFQGLAIGFPVIDVIQGVHRGGSEIWPGIRGGVGEMVHHGGNALRVQIGAQVADKEWEYGLQMGRGQSVNFVPTISKEWLVDRTDDRSITLNEIPRSILLCVPIKDPDKPEIDASPIREFLARSRVLDLVPARMRGYSQRTARQLSSEGENLSSVLMQLVEQDDFKADLVDWISELCAPRIEDIDFIHVRQTDDVIFQLIEQGGTRITAKAVSDGTLRFLGLLAALWTLPRESMVCLEEVERGLHPSRIDLLMQLLVQVVRERKLQIIATTHSPRVLHALGEIDRAHLGNALVFGRPAESSGTVVRRLADLPAFEDALKKRSIDQLFTMQWLEMAM